MYLGIIRFRPTAYSTVTIRHNPFQTHSLLNNYRPTHPFHTHSLQHSYHPTQFFQEPQPTAQLPSNTIRSRPTAYSSYHLTQSVPDPQPTAQLPFNTIRSRPTAYWIITVQPISSKPTAYSTVTTQHNSFQNHNLQHSYNPTQSVPDPQPTAVII